MTTTTLRTLLVLALAPVGFAGCGGDSDEGTEANSGGGKADDVNDLDPAEFACASQFSDSSLRADRPGRDFDRLVELNDPFAIAVLKEPEGGCPTSFNDVLEKLAVTDAEECSGTNGMKTALVSEIGQHTDEDGEFRFDVDQIGFRAVSARECGGRNTWEMVFSLFGASADRLPQEPEVIAWDAEAGVFNYYVLGGRGWEWHGNSIDAVEGTNRCGNCHDDGGLIQKELDSPWVHWEHFDDIQGSKEFHEQFGELIGSRGSLDGASVETRIVEPSTRTYVELGFVPTFLGEKGDATRMDHLLRPLFCTEEINLQSGGNTSDDGSVTFRTDFFLAREFASFDPSVLESADRNNQSIRLQGAVYNAGRERADQDVRRVPGEVDTHRRLTYPERSFADAAVVGELINREIVTQDMVSDILMVDYTRPIFSETRCDLLDVAIEGGAFDRFTTPDTVTAEALRTALSDVFAQSEAPGAAELADALKNEDDNKAQKEERDSFMAACAARLETDEEEFVDDLFIVLSSMRNEAVEKEGSDKRGPTHIIEDSGSMVALDRLDSFDAHFDTNCCVDGRTCTAPAPEPEPEDDGGDTDGGTDGGDTGSGDGG